MFVTDHFLNGNVVATENLSWPERVEKFCLGYEVAAQKGREIGLDVFFGWEYSYGWAHFLTYGLDKNWLLANPDVLSWDLIHYFQKVREDGGAIVHAHPFREKVDIVQLVPNHVDAIEVLNGGRAEEYNRHAMDYALSFKLPHTAGSDIHSAQTKRLCGMKFSRQLASEADYVAAIKSQEGVIFELNLTA